MGGTGKIRRRDDGCDFIDPRILGDYELDYFSEGEMKKGLDPGRNYCRWHRHDQVFRLFLYYYSGPSFQLACDSMRNTLKLEWPFDGGAHEKSPGVCISFAGTRAYMIWTPNHDPKPGVIVHETFHMMTWLAAKMDSQINESNEEFFSQYQEYVYDELMEVLAQKQYIMKMRK